jgi:hypothetical protein
MQIAAKQTLNVLGAMALIYASYLPAALYLKSNYIFVARPPGEIVEPLGGIRHVEGFGYKASTTVFFMRYADNDPDNQRSPIILYENLTPLGPAHSAHPDIQFLGHGRDSQWSDNPKSGWRQIGGVLFSASDNSDPRTNGRHYWAVLPATHASAD